MEFISVQVICPEQLRDYLISELFEIGFDSFQELEDGFEGSCGEINFKSKEAQKILIQFPTVSFKIKEQEKINWNKEWEKNYDPIIIEEKCIVRASFHEPSPAFEYEIIVTPKMSFGTGHHATTYQILAYQMELGHEGKRVLDVGTGTGILAIMANKRGAKELVVTDIDEWCIENSTENFELNKLSNYKIYQSEIEQLGENDFDIIIANINKNVLLDQIGAYSNKMKVGATLILSGFYKEDIADLTAKSQEHFLIKKKETVKDNWAMLVLTKQTV